MPAPDPQKLLRMAAQISKTLNRRIVLVAGWTEVTDQLKNEIFGENNKAVLIVDSAPHDWLFPQCACIVHHGGVGTVAAALRAGIPSVVCPVYLDQPFWGIRLHQLGVAPEPIAFQKLTTENLVSAIRAVLAANNVGNAIRARAKELAHEINKDGIQNALKIVEEVANAPPKFIKW